MKLTPGKAAAKAFRDCRTNSDASRHAASFLAKQHMLASGATAFDVADSMQEIDQKLDEWFNSRENDPGFTPDATAIKSKAKPDSGEKKEVVL